jgi:hypothetical protein
MRGERGRKPRSSFVFRHGSSRALIRSVFSQSLAVWKCNFAQVDLGIRDKTLSPCNPRETGIVSICGLVWKFCDFRRPAGGRTSSERPPIPFGIHPHWQAVTQTRNMPAT